MPDPRPDCDYRSLAVAALAGSPVTVRAATPEDLPVLATIYATTRSDELALVDWSDEQKRAFTDSQSALQEEHYARHYPGAERLVIIDATTGRPIGRVYVRASESDIRLMEMTLLPEWRSRGIGSRLMDALLAYSRERAWRLSLHVEPFNPAKRMYDRLGFVAIETRGIYEFMVRAATP